MILRVHLPVAAATAYSRAAARSTRGEITFFRGFKHFFAGARRSGRHRHQIVDSLGDKRQVTVKPSTPPSRRGPLCRFSTRD